MKWTNNIKLAHLVLHKKCYKHDDPYSRNRPHPNFQLPCLCQWNVIILDFPAEKRTFRLTVRDREGDLRLNIWWIVMGSGRTCSLGKQIFITLLSPWLPLWHCRTSPEVFDTHFICQKLAFCNEKGIESQRYCAAQLGCLKIRNFFQIFLLLIFHM